MAGLLIALGYLSGSIPFGLLLTRWHTGRDVRASGSGNLGATNVARVAGKGLGALVLMLDAAKGALPVWLGLFVFPGEPLMHVAIGAAAFLGHVFPLWLKFRGGKGVATALGVLLVLAPVAALAGFAAWLLVMATLRISSVGSLLGAATTLIVGFLRGWNASLWLAVGFFVALLWTHRENLRRLWGRRERRI